MMDAKTYLKISSINLLFLSLGVVLGMIITLQVSSVHAQATKATATESNGTKDSASVRVTPDPNAEYVTPAVTIGGPAVTNTLLANTLACDRLQVNGFEPLRLNDAILGALVKKNVLTQADVQAIVVAGKAEHPLRIKPQ